MSDHLTEEEQLENLKRLWKEYGTTVIASVVVATAGYFGWNYWQDAEQQRLESASNRYEELVTAVGSANAPQADDAEASKATVSHLSEQIKSTASDSAYAVQGAFFAAKKAVESGDLTAAEGELQWVLANADSEAMKEVARIRLARVLAAKGDFSAALNQVSSEPAAGFAAEQAEVRGDILRQNGDSAAALTAYEKALESLTGDQQQRRMVLQMKIDNTKPASSEEPSA